MVLFAQRYKNSKFTATQTCWLVHMNTELFFRCFTIRSHLRRTDPQRANYWAFRTRLEWANQSRIAFSVRTQTPAPQKRFRSRFSVGSFAFQRKRYRSDNFRRFPEVAGRPVSNALRAFDRPSSNLPKATVTCRSAKR